MCPLVLDSTVDVFLSPFLIIGKITIVLNNSRQEYRYVVCFNDIKVTIKFLLMMMIIIHVFSHDDHQINVFRNYLHVCREN